MSAIKIDKMQPALFKKTGGDSYSDQSEDFLLKFFDKPQSQKEKKITKILANNPPWPILYHLSPQREFLLDWYQFKKNASILEIGAGCGALTGLFTRKLKKVYSNELTSIRGKIIAHRFSDKPNLVVYAGNLIDLALKSKVDYVSAIGVLEYSGKYIPHNTSNNYYQPFLNFLILIKKFLSKNGHLLLAIENKIGLKYLAGGKEDHYGTPFESIESYPSYQGIRTFSKNELTDLLYKAGFKETNFYYPFPDYKMPSSILTDEGLNQGINISKSSYASIVDLSNERIPLFSEIAMADNLDRENILGKFSNSFLIDAIL